MEPNPSYADGLRDGQIQAIEKMQIQQNTRIDGAEQRISVLEKFAWVLGGVVLLVQFAPAVRSFLGL